jgi:phosphonate transport system substrate-binding protein
MSRRGVSVCIGFLGLASAFVGFAGLHNSASVSAKEVNMLAQNNSQRLRVVFPSRADSADLQRKADAVAEFLSKDLKMPVEAIVADETAAVEALRSNRADVAFLGSRGALKAEKLANAKLVLAEVRPGYSGGFTYRSIFVVRKDSPLASRGSNMATLSQLKGKKMAFTSPTSGSGFIVPVGELVKLKLVEGRDRLEPFFGQITYGGGYSGALQAVLRKQADVAAVSEYTLNPPYVTEAEAGQLRILASIPGVPAHGISIDDDVSGAMRTRIVNALMKLNQPANNGMFKALYNSTQLVRVDHNQHLAPMRDALQRAGIDP